VTKIPQKTLIDSTSKTTITSTNTLSQISVALPHCIRSKKIKIPLNQNSLKPRSHIQIYQHALPDIDCATVLQTLKENKIPNQNTSRKYQMNPPQCFHQTSTHPNIINPNRLLWQRFERNSERTKALFHIITEQYS
jgi:hypothetical protein